MSYRLQFRQSTLQLILASILVSILVAGGARPIPARADFGTWSSSGPNAAILSIAIDPADEQVIYAAGDSGLWKTVDGGKSWALVNSLLPLSGHLEIDAFEHNTLYAVSGDSRSIVKSVDGGTTWAPVYTVRSGGNLQDLLADPNQSSTIYAALGGSVRAQIIRTDDAGVSWSVITQPDIGQGSIGGAQITSLAMLPGLADLLYAGVQIYHGGYIMLTSNSIATNPDWSIVAGQGEVASTSAPYQIVLAGDIANRSAYSSWIQTGQGELARNDNDGSPLKLGNKLPFQAGGKSAYLTAMTANPIQATWLYAAIENSARNQHAIFATQDRGESWTAIGSLAQEVSDLKLAVRSHTLYAATAQGVYQYALTWPVANRFADFYRSYDGIRLLGNGISLETAASGYAAQYFEKGRIEDHQGESADLNWRFMYGLLVDELQQAAVQLPVGGDTSSMSYADLHALALPNQRRNPPQGYPGSGTYTPAADGTTFVPFSGDLSGAPGHNVLGGFWQYINRRDLFPGGWLHDVGLPISEPVPVAVSKNLPGGPEQRMIIVQAFQRTILTYDPANPPEWQIERANAGSDYRLAFPERAGP